MNTKDEGSRIRLGMHDFHFILLCQSFARQSTQNGFSYPVTLPYLGTARPSAILKQFRNQDSYEDYFRTLHPSLAEFHDFTAEDVFETNLIIKLWSAGRA